MTEQNPAAQQSKSLFYMMLFMGIMMLFLLFPDLRNIIGYYVGFVLDPTIGFGNAYPVITIILAGFLVTVISTVIRHFMTDWVKQAKDREASSALNKELRQAQKDNNLYKMKRLQELQMEQMANQGNVMAESMKPMMVTMVFFFGIFAWLNNFLYDPMTFEWCAFGYSQHFHLFENFLILPHFILVYMLVSISFGQLLQKALKYYLFKKKLEEMGG
ncbi:MAG TPA: DUF106 domain-containing protein [Euryarchaeota archaeon]|nr:DUF106 domain-containing protein [Euryarchaeota archaeon]